MNIKSTLLAPLFLAMFFLSCAEGQNQQDAPITLTGEERDKLEQATFAGGCFWCIEGIFEAVEGVKEVVSGYSGGSEQNPTYKQVSSGKTGHAEAVMIYYDPEIVRYDELLEIFFDVHDPTTLNRQGPDVGPQYRSVILYHNQTQKNAADAYKKKLDNAGKFEKPIVTQIVPFHKFYVAEDYHQDYCRINPNDPYVKNVSLPKFEKFKNNFEEKLKADY